MEVSIQFKLPVQILYWDVVHLYKFDLSKLLFNSSKNIVHISSKTLAEGPLRNHQLGNNVCHEHALLY